MHNKTGKQELHDRFDTLLNEAEQNEIKLRKFQAFELQLMNADSLAQLLDTLFVGVLAEFNWEMTGLAIYDPTYEFQRLLSISENATDQYPRLSFIDDPKIMDGAMITQPTLLSHGDVANAKVFSDTDDKPDHLWLLPLNKPPHFIGYYYVGKLAEDDQNELSATDFLQHFAAVIAICLMMNIDRENLRYLGLKDPLTGINNRRFFDQRLTEEVTNAIRSNIAISCLFIDIDHFKRINDMHGHRVGDIILKGVAQKIRWLLRITDVCARYGGEEFTALLLNQEQPEATLVAERIRSAVENTAFNITDQDTINVTISIGISTFENGKCIDNIEKTALNFVDCADHALYEAKRTGRNRVVVHAYDLN